MASPLSPADAQKQFVLADASLRIELAAAEPEVVDPVAIRFDEDGRMWVAEMRDYPLGPPAGGQPLSQIRVLEDRDGDGRFETATTFADKLSFVTGLAPWKGGVFVTLSGRVAYMKDTDGDGRCDLDETWYEGFAEQNSQLRANHPRLALDNHIYVANGLRGGKVVNCRLKDEPVIDISGMDFRFDPLTGKAEAVSGNGQFGLCFDDWGNRFTCTNRNPCRHVVIEDRYLRASPGVTVPAVMHDVGAFAEASHIFPISQAWTTSNLHAGTFTAACGVYIYRGDLLPEEFRCGTSTHAKLHPVLRSDFPEEFLSSVFTCDPTGNLIHREIMKASGPTFTSKPAYEGKEFLASPDEWFRPVNMELGPDGALYVVDMYRCVIEHPDFVPDELKKRPDLRLGDDRGRIWRILPKVGPAGPSGPEPQENRSSPALSKVASANLVQLLAHTNAWQRETAQRLLIERAERAVAPAVRDCIAASENPLGRAHALWTLAGLGQLRMGYVAAALEDDHAAVRRQGLLLAEPTSTGRIETSELKPLLGDRDRAVRSQAMLTLIGSAEPPLRLPLSMSDAMVLGRISASVNDPWTRRAALLFLGPDGSSELIQLMTKDLQSAKRELKPAQLQFLEELGELAAVNAGKDQEHAAISTAAAALGGSQPEVGLSILTGLARRWARGQGSPVDPATGKSALPADRLVTLSQSAQVEMATRTRAIALLAFVPSGAFHLANLSTRNQEQTIRIAAIGALSRQPGIEPWEQMLDGFPSDTPAARRAILDGLLANADRTKLLLDAIEAGKIKPSELDPSHAKRLTESRDASIKERAGKLFAAATPAERAQVLADYQVSLEMKADAKHGIAIFEKHCAACHKVGTVGVNVAPDISDSRTKTAAQILGDIILPNRAIDNNYLGYSVRLVDGTVASGILTTETATSITLRQQGGKDLVIARSEIEELKSSGVSLMPEGLERQIPPQDMADLVAFIKNWRYLDGKTPLSNP
ncbi:MAG: c-type cytochrome [Planctomycetaceae bacterium]|nr:c-type cytochrome [Planctomycetaceae bacterium]